MPHRTSLCAFLLVSFAGTGSMLAQGLTGQISGMIADSSDAAVANAQVEILNTQTGQVRSAKTNVEGYFVFTELLPGTFTLTVTAGGFKKYEQRDVVVTATERVTLPKIALTVGGVTETVSVTAAAARVQTESSERSGLIGARQMQELPLKGRDYLGMAKLLPGIIDTANREYPVSNNLVGININGTRAGTIGLNIDGVTNLDTGSMVGPNHAAPGLDSIAEVRVLLSNYQAEYGRSSGGTINIVIKNGTRDFRGGAYYFFRNEDLNANEFFNNRGGIARPRYRFNYPGYFLGGPVLLPGTRFNRNRDKLFFFWSQEFLPLTVPSSLSNQTFPTALEREGNFSKSLDQSGALIAIADSSNNRVPFPGNIVPSNRIDAAGQKLLSLFPLPNAAGPGGTYNWQGQSINQQPRHDSILRVDYNLTQNTQFYVRLMQDRFGAKGYFGLPNALGGSNSWPQLPIDYEINSPGVVATLIHTFGPHRVNEFTFGVNRGKQTVEAQTQAGLDANTRSKIGLKLPQFYPEANPLNLIPNATFAGVPSAGQLNLEQRFPFFGTNNIWSYADNFSNIAGPHNIKAGFYLERATRNAATSSSFNGTLAFGRNANNALDTNYAYSNAILGIIDSYTESSAHPAAHGRYVNFEWYVQDNWKVSRRFTVEAGVRFYYSQPTLSAGDTLAAFDMAAYDRKQQPPLVQPYLNPANRQRVAIDPATGQLLPAVRIGTFSSAAGTPYQGMTTFHESIANAPPIQIAPRIGFSWDVFGNGRTALRTGFGIFYDRPTDDTLALRFVSSPPLVKTATANYTTLANLLTAPLSLSPAGVVAMQRDYSPPAVYNWSFGIQQNIGWGALLDVAYVGNTQKHLMITRDLNALPYGTNFLPSSLDSTLSGNTPLPTNFLRPRPGYGSIDYTEFAASANYNSFQTQLTRRFSPRLTFNVNYTWSKALDLVDGGSAVNPLLNYRMRSYGLAGFDRRHNFMVNYIYSMPAFSKHWDNLLSRIALDGWQVSGVSSFIAGAPSGIGYSLSYAADLTGAAGSGVDSRVVLVGDPNGPAPAGQRFNIDAVKPPTAAYSVNGIGNAGKTLFTLPGIDNWDISLFKNFRLGAKEERRLQFRFETYNTFNHTQYSGVDTASRFDATGKQINTNLGYYTAAQLGRRVALGLKLYF